MGDRKAARRQAQRETTGAGSHGDCLDARKPTLDLALEMRLVNYVIQQDLVHRQCRAPRLPWPKRVYRAGDWLDSTGGLDHVVVASERHLREILSKYRSLSGPGSGALGTAPTTCIPTTCIRLRLPRGCGSDI